MVGEGDEGEVSGKGVPPGAEGGFSQPVPEDSHPLPLSPKHMKRQRNTNDKVSLSLSVTHLTQPCDKTSDSKVHVVIRSITSFTAFYKQGLVLFSSENYTQNTEYKRFLCLWPHPE